MSRHATPIVLLLAAALAGDLSARQALPDSTRIAVNRVFARWSSNSSPGCDVPITPSSIFHVASVSKQFTMMAVLLLAQDGKLSLDDDIRTHLPELPDYGPRITIRHLFTRWCSAATTARCW